MNADVVSLGGYLLLAFAIGWSAGYLVYAFRKFSEYL